MILSGRTNGVLLRSVPGLHVQQGRCLEMKTYYANKQPPEGDTHHQQEADGQDPTGTRAVSTINFRLGLNGVYE